MFVQFQIENGFLKIQVWYKPSDSLRKGWSGEVKRVTTFCTSYRTLQHCVWVKSTKIKHSRVEQLPARSRVERYQHQLWSPVLAFPTEGYDIRILWARPGHHFLHLDVFGYQHEESRMRLRSLRSLRPLQKHQNDKCFRTWIYANISKIDYESPFLSVDSFDNSKKENWMSLE